MKKKWGDVDRSKEGFKQYADNRRHAKEPEIQPEDKVLLMQRSKNNLSTPYSPDKHTVVWKSDSCIGEIRWNWSFFQPIKERDLQRFGGDHRVINILRKEVHKDDKDKNEQPPVTTDSLTTTLHKRHRQPPAKYKDFVLGLIIDGINSLLVHT